jgi:1,4-dihydroxy-2-naphthoyl-CoA hydrolase
LTAIDNPDSPGADLDRIGAGFLPGLLGIRFNAVGAKVVEAQLDVRKALMAPNGFLHAASIVALADTACGYGCVRTLPEGATGFTTVELKTNFLGTAREGTIVVRAEPRHLGRTTQLWDAEVKRLSDDRTIALFRCTQLVLWP